MKRDLIYNVTQHRGFTLIELVVVILIMGIIGFVAGPRFVKTSVFAERRAADEVLSALHFTQQMAMARGGGIQFRLSANNYTVEETNGTPLQSPDRSGPYSKTLPNGVTASPVTLAFDGLGRPVPNANAILSIGSLSITVEADTGYAHF